MANQVNKSKGPGVYIPPPLFYVLTFLTSSFVQKRIPLSDAVFQTEAIKFGGIILLIISLFFLVSSLRQFLKTKNTLVLIKPAASLQTTGIYGISRNPMYAGLAIVYLGLACLIGNWWTFILFPLLFLIVQEYIIKHEEKYLAVEFGNEYEKYKKIVRRWL